MEVAAVAAVGPAVEDWESPEDRLEGDTVEAVLEAGREEEKVTVAEPREA